MKTFEIRGVRVIERFKGVFYVYTIDESFALQIMGYLTEEGFEPKSIICKPKKQYELDKASIEAVLKKQNNEKTK